MVTKPRRADRIELLAALPLFRDLTHRELQAVADISVEARRAAGTSLTHERQHGGMMFVLVEGEAEVLASPAHGATAVAVGRLGPGDSFGELSLIDGRARSARVVAATDVLLLQIAREDFLKLVDRSPAFVRNLLRSLSLKVREADLLTS